jgi:protein O-mannosyl-transferase
MEDKSLVSTLKWILPLVLVVVAVFSNAANGEFVYDDNRQILRNPLIQDNSLIGKALTSDVWAFKGDGSIAASNYWRPTFTAWNILCFRLFGANPFGWHLFNILLHAGVCVLGFFLLRRWDLTPIIAFSICLIFAVHPVHVESATWIAGSPDLLFSLALLGSLWFAESYGKSKKTKDLAVSAALFAVALGAKEVGILCLPIYWLLFNKTSVLPKDSKPNNSGLIVYLGIAIVYFFVRLKIIGAISLPPQDATSFGNAILSIPEMFTFYLRQAVFPFWLSANYPLRPVESIGLMNFVLPLIVSIGAIVGLFFLAKRTKIGMIGFAIFILPLIPAMNATAFIPEQIVHDRYLYLPLLGLLIVVSPVCAEFLDKFKREAILIAAAIISLPLAFQTFVYNQTWLNDLAIWENAVKIDEISSFSWSQYGSELSESGKIDDAINAYQKSLQIKETERGYYGLARNLTAKKKFSEAEMFLTKALNMPAKNSEAYTMYQVYESLAIALISQTKFAEAEKQLTEARTILPIYSAALTEKLAVVYYQQGKKPEALKELESAKTQARKELLPESKTVFLRLGMLYGELGRKDEARQSLQEFMNLTASLKDKSIQENRLQATKLLQQLK